MAFDSQLEVCVHWQLGIRGLRLGISPFLIFRLEFSCLNLQGAVYWRLLEGEMAEWSKAAVC